ncbi:MAG: hypothetical protein OEX77_02150 [Candidatus Bathyarchaeota archaeon]|nr:hypothetical protein [Candidatus Bathyarchaeota archaeon]MDH5733080.1 hypothetical protein [Candidatus Bathyarchaeota archaeon]
MMWQNYQLGNTISKATEAITLWQTEKGAMEISRNTLAIPINLGDQRKGYIFHGDGKLLLDTIVETEEGAIGKPVEKKIDEPFLMLGGTEETQPHLSTANREDFTKMGYENPQEFVAKAEDLCNRFFRGRVHSRQGFDEDHGLIFSFPNETGKLDMLVTKGSKMVYKAMNIVFVSNENKVVLKSPDEVVCAKNGKSVIIKKRKSVVVNK